MGAIHACFASSTTLTYTFSVSTPDKSVGLMYLAEHPPHKPPKLQNIIININQVAYHFCCSSKNGLHWRTSDINALVTQFAAMNQMSVFMKSINTLLILIKDYQKTGNHNNTPEYCFAEIQVIDFLTQCILCTLVDADRIDVELEQEPEVESKPTPADEHADHENPAIIESA